MKSTYKQKQKQSKSQWPKVMIANSGYLVLFYANKCGVVLHDPTRAPWPIGHYLDCWVMDTFEDFHGTITIDVG